MRTTGISTADLPRGFGEQILVVDDEPNLGESLGERLRSYGYRTMVFTSSREALELFENKPDEFVLTITDQTMPELTGVELVRAMRRVRPDMPAILNSGFSDQIDADGAAGMSVCYLGKPVNMESLIQAVGGLLRPAKRQTG